MDTIKAAVTPNLLSWARRRRGVDASVLAKKLGVSPEAVAAWERGDQMPTFPQARRFARALYIPFGYLYLREPPVERVPLADFRTADPTRVETSPDLLDLLHDVLGKQQWLREYRESEGASGLRFVGRFATDSATAVAGDIRATLNVDGARRRAADGEGFLRNLVRNAEGAGISVMRSGVVGGNNYRSLSKDEFRGFSISDHVAPLVFINVHDFKGAQIFTLAHELAHIWTGKGGISNPDYGLQSELQEDSVERFCNSVAAETLVPSDDFRSRWISGSMSLEENLESLRKHYKVSSMVVLRQALDSGLIAVPEYRRRYAQLVMHAETAEAARKAAREAADKQDGNFYPTLVSRNGRAFTEAVVSSAAQGATLSSEAAHLLGVRVRSIPGIARYLAGSGRGID
jgi:Zn-dependent peptidase ImmA (M78 family)/transcriptional regulator with XRE-family HTH domain